jgi:hypothetical protein
MKVQDRGQGVCADGLRRNVNDITSIEAAVFQLNQVTARLEQMAARLESVGACARPCDREHGE